MSAKILNYLVEFLSIAIGCEVGNACGSFLAGIAGFVGSWIIAGGWIVLLMKMFPDARYRKYMAGTICENERNALLVKLNENLTILFILLLAAVKFRFP